MAVYAAHLTRTLQGTPSVFQVTAQEALGSTVKPALRKLVEYLAAVYPDKLSWSERWYDELYLLLDCIVQYHYLKHYGQDISCRLDRTSRSLLTRAGRPAAVQQYCYIVNNTTADSTLFHTNIHWMENLNTKGIELIFSIATLK